MGVVSGRVLCRGGTLIHSMLSLWLVRGNRSGFGRISGVFAFEG
jgi:hypothetical protein